MPIQPRWTLAAVLALTTLVFVGVAPASDTETEPVLALSGLDPVALVHGEEVEGQDGLTHAHGAWLYRFASEKNLKAFQEEPNRFGIQRDDCIVVPGAEAQPDIFTVYEGKIYIFATEECVQEFEAAPKLFLEG